MLRSFVVWRRGDVFLRGRGGIRHGLDELFLRRVHVGFLRVGFGDLVIVSFHIKASRKAAAPDARVETLGLSLAAIRLRNEF